MFVEQTRSSFRACVSRPSKVRKTPFYGNSFYVKLDTGTYMVFEYTTETPSLKIFVEKPTQKKYFAKFERVKTVLHSLDQISQIELTPCSSYIDPEACVSFNFYTVAQFKQYFPNIRSISSYNVVGTAVIIFSDIEFYFDFNNGQLPKFRAALGYVPYQHWTPLSFRFKNLQERQSENAVPEAFTHWDPLFPWDNNCFTEIPLLLMQ